MKLRVLLTGGSGFIGQNILEKLGDKYQFFAPFHEKLELTDEIQVDQFFKRHSIDIIIHTANIGGTKSTLNLTDVVSVNLRIFFNLVKNKKYFHKMIFLGSGAEYDKSQPLEKVSEIDFGKSIPRDDYGFYKYICSSYIENNDDIINLRLFGIYGKYEDYSQRFISNNICRLLLNLPIKIHRNVYFDYLYINDFVKIVDHFINHSPKHKFYNVGRGEKIDLLTLAKIIKKISGTDLPILIEESGLNNEYSCNTELLKKEIPRLTFTSWEDSLKELFEYYRSIKNKLTVSEVTKYDH